MQITRMKKNSLKDSDYISELPESILHQIMSFLSTEEIARATALSKTWFQAWKTFPIWKIDLGALISTRINKVPFNSPNRRHEITAIEIPKLFNSLELALSSRRNRGLIKFMLDVPWIHEEPDIIFNIDRWVGYAIENNVKHMEITVFPTAPLENFTYSVPQAVFSAISLEVLELSYCSLHILPSTGNIRLRSLKRLSFNIVFADDNVMRKLVAGCPRIEDMSINFCYGIKKLQIFNLLNLVKLHVDTSHFEHIVIEAPNLHSLTLVGSTLPSVMKVNSENLKSLAVNGVPITDKWLCVHLRRITQLESLRLFECHKLESIQISGYALHTLSIESCEGLGKVEIDTPNLQVFSYAGDRISFSSSNSILPQVHLCLESNNTENSWYVRFVELLGNFNQCFRKVILEIKRVENYIVPNQLRQQLEPPMHTVKELEVTNRWHQVADLVDAILWISPHLETLYINSKVKSIFQFSYKNPTCESEREKESNCYKCLPVSCWSHCIKDVKVKQIFSVFKNINGNRRRVERDYIFHEDIWENIRNIFQEDMWENLKDIFS